ncbi:MAG: SPASM domain-containing protein [Bacillota bacterium]
MFGFPFAFIAPAFDWLQVEVTSYCNAACVYCSPPSTSFPVFTNIPVAQATYLIRGAVRQYRRVAFGSVHMQELFRIWRQKDYVSFRRSFSTGRLGASCRECSKLYYKRNRYEGTGL